MIFFKQVEVNYVLFNELMSIDVTLLVGFSSVVVVDGATRTKFKKDYESVGGHLLKHMTNSLFNLFVM